MLPPPQVYPTGVRSFFHGLSAAVGKVGALAAALAFTNVRAPRCAVAVLQAVGPPGPACSGRTGAASAAGGWPGRVPHPAPRPPHLAAACCLQVSVRAAFYASAGAGGLGLLLTLAFLPDTTGLDLHELDR